MSINEILQHKHRFSHTQNRSRFTGDHRDWRHECRLVLARPPIQLNPIPPHPIPLIPSHTILSYVIPFLHSAHSATAIHTYIHPFNRIIYMLMWSLYLQQYDDPTLLPLEVTSLRQNSDKATLPSLPLILNILLIATVSPSPSKLL